MQEIVRFIQNVVAQEYKVMIQIRTESDTIMVETEVNSLNQFFQGPPHSRFYISSSRMIEEREKVMGQLQPRNLFKIEQYLHPALGTVYRVYLSSTFHGDNSYFSNFFVTNTERFRIVSEYNICNDCNGNGKQYGKRSKFPCNECNGFGWNWRGGQKLESLGELVRAEEFAIPVKRQR